MHHLFDIIVDIIALFLPTQRNRDDRSVIGESEIDRQSRTLKIFALSAILILGLGIGAWLYFAR